MEMCRGCLESEEGMCVDCRFKHWGYDKPPMKRKYPFTVDGIQQAIKDKENEETK